MQGLDDLDRFVAAQDDGGTYSPRGRGASPRPKNQPLDAVRVSTDRRAGQSPTSTRFAISSLSQARAYLQHPVLGPQLIECASILAQLENRSAHQIFGDVDAQKLRSSMTLFERAAPEEAVFTQVLDRYFGGMPDPATHQRL